MCTRVKECAVVRWFARVALPACGRPRMAMSTERRVRRAAGGEVEPSLGKGSGRISGTGCNVIRSSFLPRGSDLSCTATAKGEEECDDGTTSSVSLLPPHHTSSSERLPSKRRSVPQKIWRLLAPSRSLRSPPPRSPLSGPPPTPPSSPPSSTPPPPLPAPYPPLLQSGSRARRSTKPLASLRPPACRGSRRGEEIGRAHV